MAACALTYTHLRTQQPLRNNSKGYAVPFSHAFNSNGGVNDTTLPRIVGGKTDSDRAYPVINVLQLLPKLCHTICTHNEVA